MSEDLVAFLRARLDDDGKLARAASSLCGCHPSTPRWDFDDSDEGDGGRIIVIDHPHPGVDRLRIEKRWNRTYADQFMARHIARHNPARVLREVEAKRRMLDETVGQLSMLDGEFNGPPSVDDFLKLLAMPYAAHPGFREEWRT